MPARIFIGTSGYSYQHWWNGVFYPTELPQSRWLEYYTSYFNTVELNSTFYRLPQAKAFESWRRRSPDGFLFAVKASRFITHIKKLKDIKEPLGLLFGRLILLNKKLGPVLFQLPPNFRCDANRLNDFLAQLPKGYKYAFEFRHISWFNEEIYELLNSEDCALCIADYPNFGSSAATHIPITASWVYLRFHGATALYASCYSKEELMPWADKIKSWAKEDKEVYVYFNNDAHGYAVKNAKQLLELCGLH